MNQRNAFHPTRRAAALALATAAAAGTAVLGVTPAARAATPTPVSATFTLAAGESCAFPVRIDVTGGNVFHVQRSGTTIVAAPGLVADLTNLTTGRTVHEVISGPGKLIPRTDGKLDIVLEGRNLNFGPGYLTIGIGRAVGVLDPATGLLDAPPTPPRSVDLCPALARA